MNLQAYWQGKHVLVSGASSGLGKAVVQALSPFGVTFCLLSRRGHLMQELADSLSKTPSTFWIRPCDVRHRDEIEKAIGDFVRAHGHLDVAWVNSGLSGDTFFSNWDWTLVENILDTNLKGAMYTIHTALRHMVPRAQGTVVTISSAAAMFGLPSRDAYSPSKVAIAYYTESLAPELPSIQFTNIYPGYVDTQGNHFNKSRFFLLTPAIAAQKMISAVARGKEEFIFPFGMKLIFKLMRFLPIQITRRIARKYLAIYKNNQSRKQS